MSADRNERRYYIVIRSARGAGWHTVTLRTFGPVIWPWLQRPGNVEIIVRESA